MESVMSTFMRPIQVYVDFKSQIINGSEYEMRALLLGFTLQSVRVDYPKEMHPLVTVNHTAFVEATLGCQCGRREIATGTMPVRDGKIHVWKSLWLAGIFTAKHLEEDGLSSDIVAAAAYLEKLPFNEDLELLPQYLQAGLSIPRALEEARNYNERSL